MLISLTTLFATLFSIFRSRAALELKNLALRHQIGVLQRSARKRPRLTSGDRPLWICLSRLWRDWRSTLAIVKPKTVVAGWWNDNGRQIWVGFQKFSICHTFFVGLTSSMASDRPSGDGIAYPMKLLEWSSAEALPSSVTFSNALSLS